MNRAASSKLLYHNSADVKAWLGNQLGLTFVEPCYAIGVINHKGLLTAAAVYTCYEERNVELSVAGRIGRHAAVDIFYYAFNRLGCRRISATVHEKKQDVIRQAIGMGWKIEGRKREYYGEGEDAIILGMLRSECRVLQRGDERGIAKRHQVA